MALRTLSKTKKSASSARSSSTRSDRTTTFLQHRNRRRLSLRERRRRMRLIITLVAVVLVIGAGVGLSWLSFSPAVTLSSIQVKGNNLVSSDDVLALVKSQTAAAYFGVFSKDNIALFPTSAVEKQITSTYKTIASAAVSFSGLHNATIVVEERKPAALWCTGSPVTASPDTSDCFYMDKTGYIFNPAPQFNGAVYVSYFGLITGERASDPTGTQFLAAADFQKLTDFVSAVSRFGVQPVSVTMEPGGDGTLRLISGGSILFSRTLDYTQTLENLNSIITAEQATLHGTFLKNLDYVNVRFGTKAFFKLRTP